MEVKTLVQRTVEELQRRRDKLLDGGINSIPSPFTRFKSEFLGIEQGKYYVITGATKSAKTQLASFLFLYTPLLYAYENPDKLKLTIFYYPLEENPQDILQRFISFLLFKLSGGKYRISPTELQSSDNTPISQEILDLIQDGEYANLIQFFEETVRFSSTRNATGMYKEVKKYMEDNGTVHMRKQKIKDDFGNTQEIEVFDYYEPNNPDEYVLVIYDHLSLTQPENNMSDKQSMDKVSSYCVMLRNRYKVSPVIVQQQSFEGESLDAFKANKLRPTAQGLADSKYSARDANVLLGIFNPVRHELPDYKKYDITKLQDNVRFLEVILNRGGRSGGLIALYFDGATCYWKELPPSSDTKELEKVYAYLKSIRSNSKMFFMKLLNKIT